MREVTAGELMDMQDVAWACLVEAAQCKEEQDINLYADPVQHLLLTAMYFAHKSSNVVDGLEEEGVRISGFLPDDSPSEELEPLLDAVKVTAFPVDRIGRSATTLGSEPPEGGDLYKETDDGLRVSENGSQLRQDTDLCPECGLRFLPDQVVCGGCGWTRPSSHPAWHAAKHKRG